jgi:hypothetical protein
MFADPEIKQVATFEDRDNCGVMLLTDEEKESKAGFWFKDPRLMHLNQEYSKETIIKKIAKDCYDHDLLKAYKEIIDFNNWAQEFNYVLDVF